MLKKAEHRFTAVIYVVPRRSSDKRMFGFGTTG